MRKAAQWRRSVFNTIAGAVLGAASAHAAAIPQYTLQDLGTLGGSSSAAFGINNSGQVVGYSALPGNLTTAPVLFGTGGAASINLGTLGGAAGNAFDINDAGQIVGHSALASGSGHPTLFESNGAQVVDLLSAFPFSNGSAQGINNLGDIVGSTPLNGAERATLFGTGGAQNTFLGTLGGTISFAFDVNDARSAVGAASTVGNSTILPVSFDLETGAVTPLAVLANGSRGAARALNESGMAVGEVVIGAGGVRATLFNTIAGTATNLGTLGGTFSLASDINESGVVVGETTTATGQRRGFIWSESSGMVDLNSLLVTLTEWTVVEAWAINDSGQIAANGRSNLTGQIRALLLTPVPVVTDPTELPEPNALGLIGLAIVMSGVVTRRSPMR